MSDLGIAIALTAEAFKHDTDKGGTPYILHCLHVMHAVTSLGHDVMMAAVMHDLLEDKSKKALEKKIKTELTPKEEKELVWTSERLLKMGFSPAVVGLVELVTHLDGETYDDYIMRVSVSARGRAIKMEDLAHNSLIHRMKGLRDKDFARLTKYHKAYAFLKDIED